MKIETSIKMSGIEYLIYHILVVIIFIFLSYPSFSQPTQKSRHPYIQKKYFQNSLNKYYGLNIFRNNSPIYKAKGRYVIVYDDIILDDTLSFNKTARLAKYKHLGDAMGNVKQISRQSGRFWPNSTVPFSFDKSISEEFREVILASMDTIESRTNINFVEKSTIENVEDFVEFEVDPSLTVVADASFIGRQGKKQVVVFNKPRGHNTIYHELLHVLGCGHEEWRHDRDNFIEFKKSNVIKEAIPIFDQRLRVGNTNINEEDYLFNMMDYGNYDYHSVMHISYNYLGRVVVIPNTEEEKDDTIQLKTIINKTNPSDSLIGANHPRILSDLDVEGINFFYPSERDNTIAFKNLSDIVQPTLGTNKYRYYSSFSIDSYKSDNEVRELISSTSCAELRSTFDNLDIELFIDAMLDGPTLNEDENSILKILDCLDCERRRVISNEVGVPDLQSDLDGPEDDELQLLLAECNIISLSNMDDDATRRLVSDNDCSQISDLSQNNLNALLRNLIAGACLDDDEQAINKILGCLNCTTRRQILGMTGTQWEDFDEAIHGAEWREFKEILGRCDIDGD